MQKSQPVNLANFWKLGKYQLQQFLWHSHAYGTIFGIMFLTLGSLIFLGIHWTYRKLFFTPSVVEANKWDLGTSK